MRFSACPTKKETRERGKWHGSGDVKLQSAKLGAGSPAWPPTDTPRFLLYGVGERPLGEKKKNQCIGTKVSRKAKEEKLRDKKRRRSKKEATKVTKVTNLSRLWCPCVLFPPHDQDRETGPILV